MNPPLTDTSQLEVFVLRRYTLRLHKPDVRIDLFDHACCCARVSDKGV